MSIAALRSKLQRLKVLSSWQRSKRNDHQRVTQIQKHRRLTNLKAPTYKDISLQQSAAAAPLASEENEKLKKRFAPALEPTSEDKPQKRPPPAVEPISDERPQKRPAPSEKQEKLTLEKPCKRQWQKQRSALLQLALRPGKQRKSETRKKTFEETKPSKPAAANIDVSLEIDRILSAESPEDALGVSSGASEDAVAKAWKRLCLLLHPDKLQCLSEELRATGADALHTVNCAKDELRQKAQEICAQVPAPPSKNGIPRLLNNSAGSRKYEISWLLPQTQDPAAPIERYEVWGPKYFSEPGEPFDWVLLATLPPLQSQFVIVEEAPTQQDVMWAADRVLRPTMPLAVHAVNGKGSSEALTFECPWAKAFPWLQGVGSILCNQCFRLTPRHSRQGFQVCIGCSAELKAELAVVVRCPECGGEVLWQQNSLSCTCCKKPFGCQQSRKPQPPRYAPPQQPWNSDRQGGRHWQGRSGGGRKW
eukprot:TRINITY_DN34264_c0_g1_i1.p1 TRINITY_DN34264_c0_g1~~TRINITY_DN34264_c0_g1_i1.p1  ORF type:complete len:477 (+),score=96.44 TRINITY_DN34264_c0_g1_i1:117-1547(+)